MKKKKSGPRKGSKYIGTNKYPIGRTLADIRMLKGYTQAQLAERSGLSRRVISSLEREVQNPSTETIKKVAEALSIPIEKLLFADQNAPMSEDVIIDKSLYKRFQAAQRLPLVTKNELKKIIDAFLLAHNKKTENTPEKPPSERRT